jgi:hypothetical protein
MEGFNQVNFMSVPIGFVNSLRMQITGTVFSLFR